MSFTSDKSLTLLAKSDLGVVVAYISGYFIAQRDFLITQGFSEDSKVSATLLTLFEKKVEESGGTRLLLHTKLRERVFRKYGFKLERYLLTKWINNGG